MKIKYRTNLVAGVIALIAAIILFVIIPSQVGVERRATYGITSRTIPYAMAFLMAGCGAGLIIQSIIFKKDEVKEIDLLQEGKGLLYMGVIVLYAIGFSKSFLISTSLLGVVTLAMQKDKKPLHYIVVSLCILSSTNCCMFVCPDERRKTKWKLSLLRWHTC